jgi:hypothetical protein
MTWKILDGHLDDADPTKDVAYARALLIYRPAMDDEPLGGAVLISPTLALTATHVLSKPMPGIRARSIFPGKGDMAIAAIDFMNYGSYRLGSDDPYPKVADAHECADEFAVIRFSDPFLGIEPAVPTVPSEPLDTLGSVVVAAEDGDAGPATVSLSAMGWDCNRKMFILAPPSGSSQFSQYSGAPALLPANPRGPLIVIGSQSYIYDQPPLRAGFLAINERVLAWIDKLKGATDGK